MAHVAEAHLGSSSDGHAVRQNVSVRHTVGSRLSGKAVAVGCPLITLSLIRARGPLENFFWRGA